MEIVSLPKSAAEARLIGAARYFTGKPCAKGHITYRVTNGMACQICLRENSALWRNRHPERAKETILSYLKINPEKRKKTVRKHYEKYADAIKEKKRKYNKDYPDRVNLALRKWRHKNIDKVRIYARKQAEDWSRNNPEAKKRISKKWKKLNPENCRNNLRLRRARKAGASGSYTENDLSEIISLQKNKCAYCRIEFSLNRTRTLDHIIALSRGGSNDRRNLQFLCKSCNSSKRAQDPIDYARKIGRLI